MSFNVTSTAGPAGIVLIKVMNGKLVSFKPAKSDDDRPIDVYDDNNTIERLFEKIKTDVEKGYDVHSACDPQLGHPILVSVSNRGPNGISTILVRDLKVLKSH